MIASPRPIVWFHRGPCWYLPWTILQAQKFNPTNPQVALTDVRVSMKGVEWVDIRNHWKSADDFEKVYHHESVLPPSFDIPAIQKWFVLRDWMYATNVSQCFFADTDVLLYCDIENDSKRFSDYDVTYLPYGGPLNGYVNNRDSVNRFCQFIMDIYMDDKLFYEKLHKSRQVEPHLNVNDMTLFHWYRQQDKKLKYANLCRADTVGEHDKQIQWTRGWIEHKDRKKIVWRSGLPHAIRINGEEVRMLSLHFIGSTKISIPSFCTAPTIQKFRFFPRFYRMIAVEFVLHLGRWCRKRLRSITGTMSTGLR